MIKNKKKNNYILNLKKYKKKNKNKNSNYMINFKTYKKKILNNKIYNLLYRIQDQC